MEFLQPSTWAEALQIEVGAPGGDAHRRRDDLMVEINLDRNRPPSIIDLTRIADFAEWGKEDGFLRIGAGVTYARIIDELGGLLPAWRWRPRTVGSPQIRNRGTVGGNLGSSSPAGDAHPPLLASDAIVELASVGGWRRLPRGSSSRGPNETR